MTDGETGKLTTGRTVAARYRVDGTVGEGSARPTFHGTDTTTNAGVVLVPLRAGEDAGFRPIVGLEHPHLASLLAVVALEDGAEVLVAERVEGATLRDVLAQGTHETPIEAARSTLRIADAVCAVHHAGGAHGGIRPESICMAPEGHAPPRLAFAPPGDVESPYRSPERGADDPPSAADDAWAMAAVLYETLVGHPPEPGGISSDEELVAAELQDDALRSTLMAALSTSPADRPQDLHGLRRALAHWFVVTGDDATPVHSASHPPPLPAGAPPGPASLRSTTVDRGPKSATVSQGAGRRRSPLLAMAAAAAVFVVTIALVWGVSVVVAPSAEVIEVHRPAASSPSTPGSASINLGEVPVTGDHQAVMGDEKASCVAAYLPPGAFGKTPDLKWICAEKDALEGAGQLRAAIVAARPTGQITDAMKLWSRLDWYELAVYSVVRTGCCVDAPALEVPSPTAECARIDSGLTRVGADVSAGKDPASALREFTDAATCEAKVGRAAAYRQKGPPTSAGVAAFHEYLRSLGAP